MKRFNISPGQHEFLTGYVLPELRSTLEDDMHDLFGDRLGKDEPEVTDELKVKIDKITELLFELDTSHCNDSARYPFDDWRLEVASNHTRLGYRDWVKEQKGPVFVRSRQPPIDKEAENPAS